MNHVTLWIEHWRLSLREKRDATRREGEWYHGGVSLPVPKDMIHEALQEMSGMDAPDWILILRGVGLPGGGRSEVLLRLWENLPSGFATSWSEFGRRAERSRWIQNEIPLAAKDCHRFLEILQNEKYSNLGKGGMHVKDGFPCVLSVIRRADKSVETAQCNLCNFVNEPLMPPAARLMTMLAECFEPPTRNLKRPRN